MVRHIGAMLSGAASVRVRFAALIRCPERTLLLGGILSATAVSAIEGFLLAQYYAVDVLSSLLGIADDCWLDWGPQIGRHCFSDYTIIAYDGMQADPWEPRPMYLPWDHYQSTWGSYPAAALIPQRLFALPAQWLGAPRLGLSGYLLALILAALTPAIWASRGARGLERVVVLLALGAAAMPVWAVVDRGNSAAFLAPVALMYLLSLRDRRWGSVAVAVVLAALLKPQFVFLGVSLFAYRQWRAGCLAIGGAAVTNLAAYLLWPSRFPETVLQSIRGALSYGKSSAGVTSPSNVSFVGGLFEVNQSVVPLLGYGILALTILCVLALNRRMPPAASGTVLLVTATLFPPLAYKYYLVVALPVAALLARSANGVPGSGVFGTPEALTSTSGSRRWVVGHTLTLATIFSIAWILRWGPRLQASIAGQRGVIGVIGTTLYVPTTVTVTPLLWLVACGAIVISYARRRAPDVVAGGGASQATSPAIRS